MWSLHPPGLSPGHAHSPQSAVQLSILGLGCTLPTPPHPQVRVPSASGLGFWITNPAITNSRPTGEQLAAQDHPDLPPQRRHRAWGGSWSPGRVLEPPPALPTAPRSLGQQAVLPAHCKGSASCGCRHAPLAATLNVEPSPSVRAACGPGRGAHTPTPGRRARPVCVKAVREPGAPGPVPPGGSGLRSGLPPPGIKNADKAELKMIAEDPDGTHAYSVADFESSPGSWMTSPSTCGEIPVRVKSTQFRCLSSLVQIVLSWMEGAVSFVHCELFSSIAGVSALNS
ncbi:uncharacterized protein LOC106728836 isoform X1 [Camelus ferus]|uniref:Uncharacterized protein LOC106728836 isoform X1 n=1 Tax=Camelus ferus TaxID=419612 RepID=A0A8B8RZ46_CAMFR|nr:uncharacterized protein LOC106728836 isoform X1 [Camelus ferus]